jgi:hypothetical protein
MMIQSPAASDPVARTASLQQGRRTSDATTGDASAAPASPDVVVTLSHGASAPDTYNASGRLDAHPTLDEMGANAPDSLAKASESSGNDAKADSSSATSDASSAAAPAGSGADAKAGQDAAVPA